MNIGTAREILDLVLPLLAGLVCFGSGFVAGRYHQPGPKTYRGPYAELLKRIEDGIVNHPETLTLHEGGWVFSLPLGWAFNEHHIWVGNPVGAGKWLSYTEASTYRKDDDRRTPAFARELDRLYDLAASAQVLHKQQVLLDKSIAAGARDRSLSELSEKVAPALQLVHKK